MKEYSLAKGLNLISARDKMTRMSITTFLSVKSRSLCDAAISRSINNSFAYQGLD